MKPFISHIAIFCLILGTACTKIEPENTSQAKPVVEGYLAANHVMSLKVTNEALFSTSDTSRVINGLLVTVMDGTNTYNLSQDVNGYYTLPSLKVNPKLGYQLSFNYNGQPVSAATVIPPAPENYTASDSTIVIVPFNSSAFTGVLPTFPNPITLKWSNPDESYYIVVVKNIETNPVPINTSTNVERTFIFRSNPVQNNTYDIRARQFQYYGRHWVILYRINPEYAALYDNNGNSSLNIKTPFTNVTNGLGIFTGINADTVMVRVKSK